MKYESGVQKDILIDKYKEFYDEFKLDKAFE